jgi:hypothetical protein
VAICQRFGRSIAFLRIGQGGRRYALKSKPSMDNTRVFKMAFAGVYPHYIAKAERKGRTKEEVHAIIEMSGGCKRCWRSGWISRLSLRGRRG